MTDPRIATTNEIGIIAVCLLVVIVALLVFVHVIGRKMDAIEARLKELESR